MRCQRTPPGRSSRGNFASAASRRVYNESRRWRMTRRRFVPLVGLVLGGLDLVTTTEAWARATSGGSRGSRTYSAPSRPSPTSPTPSSPTTSTSPAAPQRPGIFGGFGGMLGGLLIGGGPRGPLFGIPRFGGGLPDRLLCR